MKVGGSKFIFMVLYVDDIMFASSDVNCGLEFGTPLLHECPKL